MRHLLAAILPLVLVLGALPATTAPAPDAVTGTIIARDRTPLPKGATAVVLLVDQTAGSAGGTLVATQRIDDARWPIAFSVPYDASAIDASHSYALYATVVDAAGTLQSLAPTPVITGGPTSDVLVTVLPRLPSATAALPVTIVRADTSPLTPGAVAIAALVREDTGTIEAYQVLTSVTTEPIALAIPYDAGLVDPFATYAVRGGIVDGSRSWTAPDPVPAIQGGTAVASVTLNAVGAGPAASASASASASPTATPTASPAATTTPLPSGTPPLEPSASPQATPAPSASEAPSAAPTPEPSEGTVIGTVTWAEGHVPGSDAKLVVALVDASAGERLGQVLASSLIQAPGDKPVAFELTYTRAGLDPADRYRIVAALIDGDLAWLSGEGVAVSVPDPLISGVAVPLTFRPDLLKAQVTGQVIGPGLDGSTSPGSYLSVLLLNPGSGQVIGYDAVAPIGRAPIQFAVPYSLADIDAGGAFAVAASAWDGTVLWTGAQPVPVITNGNPTTGVTVPLAAGATPTPSETDAPASAEPTVPPGPVTTPVTTEDQGSGVPGFIVLLAAVIAGAALLSWSAIRLRERGRRR